MLFSCSERFVVFHDDTLITLCDKYSFDYCQTFQKVIECQKRVIMTILKGKGDICMARRSNREGTVTRLENGGYEAITQSSMLNPKTLKPKRFKRRGNTAEEALANARAARDHWEIELGYGNNPEKVDRRKTLGTYMMEYLDGVVKKSGIVASTYHTYYRTMQTMFLDSDLAKLQLQMLTAKEFENYYNDLLSNYAEKSCNTPRQLLIKLCDYLCERKLIRMNFAKIAQAGIKKEVIDEYKEQQAERERQRKRIWSNDDIRKFYNAYRTGTGGEIVVIVLFMLETGVRAGEFVAITNNNIDFDKRILWIEKARSIRFKNIDIPEEGIEYYTKVTKNGEPRSIYLTDLALELVNVMQEQTKNKCKSNPENLLYPQFRKGTKRTNASMELCLKDLCNKLGIDRDVRLSPTGQKIGLSLHTCRHTYDSIANMAKGANPIATALSMGHKAISTENVYTHMTENARKEIKTASSEVLGMNMNQSSGGLTEEEEKMLYALLQKKFEGR